MGERWRFLVCKKGGGFKVCSVWVCGLGCKLRSRVSDTKSFEGRQNSCMISVDS